MIVVRQESVLPYTPSVASVANEVEARVHRPSTSVPSSFEDGTCARDERVVDSMAQRLQLRRLLRYRRGQHVRAGRAHRDIILDADADPAPAFRHRAVVR